MKSLAVAAAVMCAASCAARTPAPSRSLDGTIVSAWNAQVLAVAEAEDRFLTLKGLRTAAMMHLAMHDALNAIEPRYATWAAPQRAARADARAAAAQAAYDVASAQYPGQRARFEQEAGRWLSRVEDASAKAAGIALGHRVAAGVLASREGDGWNAEADYKWHPMAPGVYAEFREHSGTPEGFVFGAGWAIAKPFALERPGQFRSPPPPAIASEAYARAFAEVRDIGASRSATRTGDQAHMAMWWKDFVENSHNRLARQLVDDDRLDAWVAARAFALLNVAIYDSYISVFDNKFHYNHWRPYTAIRMAADDGNPLTEADVDWDNLHGHTYAFPSYPSAHGTACSAAAAVLADAFGQRRPFTMTTERVDRAGPLSEKVAIEPATRAFDSFQAAADECALSRVYLGIHFRYDSTAGTELGRRIGAHVVGRFLTRAR